jgi:hypothetical protein
MFKLFFSFHSVAGSADIRALEILCSAEIDQFDGVICSKEDVLGFEVTVYDVVSIVDDGYSFDDMRDIVFINAVWNNAKYFRYLPKFSIFWILHL